MNATKNDATGVFGSKINEVLASISVDSKSMKLAEFSLEQKRFRFKCKRCADLCCRLGEPPLTRLDVERIAKGGYSVKDFLEPRSTE